MAINVNDPDVQVTRDQADKVRQVRHPDKPYTNPNLLGMTGPTPRELADTYLREEAAQVFEIGADTSLSFTAQPTDKLVDAERELRFSEQKSIPGQSIVSYVQTQFGIPVWRSGVTVRVREEPELEVSGADSNFDYDVDVSRPSDDAPFLPEKIDRAILAQLLHIDAESGKLKINRVRPLIYKYIPGDRFHRLARTDDPGDFNSQNVPTLPLTDVPDPITPNRHYVVSEVMFTYALNNYEYNWCCLVEVETGTVLYLRALVASAASGCVFLKDPITKTGNMFTAASADMDLEAIYDEIDFLGLDDPGGVPTVQELRGKYVYLEEIEPPEAAPPKESDPYRFKYKVKSTDFAAVNAYYHCDALFRMVEEMGFDVQQYFDGTTFPVRVDFYGLKGEINAQAPGNALKNGSDGFRFGIMQVGHELGIACDSRIALHEFGHAILWDHVGSANFGFAHSPGDSLAAILHDPGSLAPDRFNTFPFMTPSNGIERRHDRNVEEGWAWGGTADNRQYGSEQILSTTLFRIYRHIGGDSNDLAERKSAARYMAYTIIKAVSGLTQITRNPDVFVSALIDADATTREHAGRAGGTLAKLFRWSFELQGLYQPPDTVFPVNKPGSPPAVDIYVDNGNNGIYQITPADYSNQLGLWNRRAADGGSTHETPIVNEENFLYVKVGNRGTNASQQVEVRAYTAGAAAADLEWPNSWTAIGAATAPTIAAGQKVVVGPITWVPTAAGERIMVSISTPGDRSSAEKFSPARSAKNKHLVPADNNLAERSM